MVLFSDSGGPLFDMDGKVIGIHSRISRAITANIHVPASYYKKDWDRLVKGEVFPKIPVHPWLGVTRDENAQNCRLALVKPNSPAAKAGLKANDIIVRFDGKKIKDFDELRNTVLRMKPGRRVEVVVRRGDEMVNLKLTIGKKCGK